MSARDRFRALFGALDEQAEAELDRRLDAHRAEVLNEAAAILRARAAQYPTRRIFAAGLRHGALVLAKAAMGRGKSSREADATPDFFQPGHTYAREHHAATIRFLARYIDPSPCGTYRVAFGWRTEDGDVCASPFDSDDLTGWVDVTEDGGRS